LENNSITYSYDANKIVDYTYDGSKVVFTYTGELITKAIYTEIDGANVFSTITTFTYENNKLKSFLRSQKTQKEENLYL
jgi:hypothetical protein